MPFLKAVLLRPEFENWWLIVKLQEYTQFKDRFRDIFPPCSSAKCSTHQQKIMEFRASGDLEAVHRSQPSRLLSADEREPVFVQHFGEIILWSWGSVETQSRHFSRKFKKTPQTDNTDTLEVLQNHSSVKPQVWYLILFLWSKAYFWCVYLRNFLPPKRRG